MKRYFELNNQNEFVMMKRSGPASEVNPPHCPASEVNPPHCPNYYSSEKLLCKVCVTVIGVRVGIALEFGRNRVRVCVKVWVGLRLTIHMLRKNDM